MFRTSQPAARLPSVAVAPRGVCGPLVRAILVVAIVLAACSPSPAVLPPFDPPAAIAATEAARTTRFSMSSTVEIAGTARELARAEGVVDLVALTGRREGRLAT